MPVWTRSLPVLFRSPLCRHVALAVFLSIVAIELIILVPSYWSQETRLLAGLRQHARIVAVTLVERHLDTIGTVEAASIARRMVAHEVVKGVELYSSDGLSLAKLGDAISMVQADNGSAEGGATAVMNGPRYEVNWPPGTLFPRFGVAVSLDCAPVVSSLRYFVLRISGLVTLIAAFVTLTTMLVLGRRLIFPMLQLRERLIVEHDEAMELDVPVANQTDEFGDIIRQFNGMLAELYQIKQGLERSIDERTAALAQSEERLRAIIDNSPSIVYLKDTDSRIVLINKAYEKRYGVTEETARGSQGHEWLGCENAEKLRKHDLAVIAGGKPVETEATHTRDDEVNFVMQSIKFPVRDRAGNIIGIGGIGTDTTARKQAEIALQQAKLEAEAAAAQAREASKAKSNFLAIMSHELRTPMNGVLGMADVISNTDLNPQQREYVDLLKDSGSSLMDLLNDILDLSKIEAGRVELERRVFSVRELVEATRKHWTHSAQDKGLSFVVRNVVAENDLIRGDRSRLRQIINNLIGNAIKFTAEGEIELRVQERPLDDGRVELRFEVQDSGIGIADDQKEPVFQPFTQADSSTTRRYGGTGLGLAICKNLVQLLGGEIGVESTPGVGSTFWFTVTADRADKRNQTAAGDETTRREAERDLSGLRLLIAEDSEINRSVVTWMLTQLKCRFDVVSNGLEAVAAVTRSNYDLVLMDIQMPEMDGITATNQIRSLGGKLGQIPIIAMTANAMQGDREKFLAAGMNDYVSKPIDQRDMFDAIARCTAGRPLHSDDKSSRPQAETNQSAQDSNGPLDDFGNLRNGTGR